MIRVWNSGTTDVAARKLLVFNMTLGCTALAYYLSNIPSTASRTFFTAFRTEVPSSLLLVMQSPSLEDDFLNKLSIPSEMDVGVCLLNC